MQILDKGNISTKSLYSDKLRLNSYGNELMKRYDVDSTWDDPFDYLEERRGHPRFDSRLTLSASREVDGLRIVGPVKLHNLSLGGYFGVTKHAVEPDEIIVTRFETSMCPDHLCLPSDFTGSARVVRVRVDGRRRFFGVVLSNTLCDNMEFAVFIEYLHGEASVAKSNGVNRNHS